MAELSEALYIKYIESVVNARGGISEPMSYNYT